MEVEYILGSDMPEKLSSTILFTVVLNFSLHGGSEHAYLTIDQFEVKIEEGRKVLVYTERKSKNHTGTLKDIDCEVKEVRAVENRTALCKSPPHLFEMYLNHRDPGITRLYLRPLAKPRGQVWYSNLLVYIPLRRWSAQ